jgi:predicted nucleotidyltransferase
MAGLHLFGDIKRCIVKFHILQKEIPMTENHKKALDQLISIHKENRENIALIIYGSTARGDARDDSDIDLYLVVTDEKFEKARRTKSLFYGTWDPDEFFGIEIDGKIINMEFLRQAVTRASDPTRASFEKAYTAFCHSEEVNDLIKKIHVYPEWEQEKRIKAFYTYVKHFRYIGETAWHRGNIFQFKRCVIDLIFFAGRLVLAHNHVLFPSHKALFKTLKKCENKPDRFIELSDALVKTMDCNTMLAYYEDVADYFHMYDYPDMERISLILENEWTWFTKNLTMSEW